MIRLPLLVLLTLCVFALTGCNTYRTTTTHQPAVPEIAAGGTLPPLLLIGLDEEGFIPLLAKALQDTGRFASVRTGIEPTAGQLAVRVEVERVVNNHTGKNMLKGLAVTATLWIASPWVEQEYTRTTRSTGTIGSASVTATTVSDVRMDAVMWSNPLDKVQDATDAENARNLAAQIVQLVGR